MPPLSKTLFLRGLQCHKSLWLKKNRKDLIPPISPATQALFDEGNLVGELARTYFPNGTFISEDYQHLDDAVASTQAALKAGAKILYEPAFTFNNVLIRADILKRADDKTSSWDMIEVKASTEAKDIHIPDLAIQRYVIEGAGIPIRKTSVMLINNEYVRAGEIDVKKLFKTEDVTDDVKGMIPSMPDNLQLLQDVLKKDKAPTIEIGKHCNKPYECDFTGFCWAHVPEYSIYDITRLKWDKKEELRERGILKVDEVPDNYALSDVQRLEVVVAKSGKTHIDRNSIKSLLSDLKYPLYFLDFETIGPGPAIPPYDGLRPFQQLPFQFSMRIWDHNKEIRHVEFLADGKTDPRPDLANALAENVGESGSVVAYNSNFEGNVLKELAEKFPKYRESLLSIESRLWDLMTPFTKRYYVHPRFHGSASLKAVLPALVPTMTYENMKIGEGGAASQAYLDIMSGKITGEALKCTRRDLLAYCGQDTMAMVKILEVLEGIQ